MYFIKTPPYIKIRIQGNQRGRVSLIFEEGKCIISALCSFFLFCFEHDVCNQDGNTNRNRSAVQCQTGKYIGDQQFANNCGHKIWGGAQKAFYDAVFMAAEAHEDH